MPKLDIVEHFSIDKVEAQKRIDTLLASLTMEGVVGNGSWSWNQNMATVSFTMHGFTFTGAVTVNETFVEVTSDLPLVALPFRGRIESTIRLRLQQVLSS